MENSEINNNGVCADTVRLFTERVENGVLIQSYQSFSAEEFIKMCAEEQTGCNTPEYIHEGDNQ